MELYDYAPAVLYHSDMVLFFKAMCKSMVFVWEDITSFEK